MRSEKGPKRHTQFGCGSGVHYFAVAVEQVQELTQLHEAQSHLSQWQDLLHEQTGAHEQDAPGLRSATIVCVFIEYLVLGLTR